MNNFTKKVLALVSAITLGFTATAQQRQVDLDVSIASPMENAVIPYNEQFNLVIAIINNGPDEMVTGDSIFYQTPFSQNVQMGTLQGNIAVGDTFAIPMTLTNTNTTGQDQTANICVYVFNPSVDIEVNGQPISITYFDTDSTNNQACVNNITLQSGATSVEEMEIAKQALVVFPNPATEKVGFRYTAQSNEEILVVVSDILGREVIRQNLGKAIQGAEKTYELDITALNTGNYILSVTDGAIQTVGRIAVK